MDNSDGAIDASILSGVNGTISCEKDFSNPNPVRTIVVRAADSLNSHGTLYETANSAAWPGTREKLGKSTEANAAAGPSRKTEYTDVTEPVLVTVSELLAGAQK